MPDIKEQSRVLTLVFTDLADSTALKSERGDAAVRDLILRHRDKVTQLAEECAGRVIDWAGDGCFLTFETSTAGVMFTLRLQQAHADESDLPGVRIGIHLGEITESPGPDNTVRIEGLAVDVAARISGLAKPGQVLMSSAIYNSARQRLGVEAMGMPLLWQLHGTYALKGFDTPLEIGEAAIQGVAALEAPKAGDKARLVRKARRQPEKFEQPASRGVPLWMVSAIVLVLVLVIGGLLLRDTPGPQTTRTSSDAPITSIAVLPFDNLMGDAEKEYFVDGMTDTLTAELSKIGDIKVIARTSAMRYKNTEKTPTEIAAELGVEGLIEGSVQQFDNEIRITAQLIDGRDERHLWGENFEGTLEGVLKLQGEVAVAIAEQIGTVLSENERTEYAEAQDVNPEAYDLYLRGRSVMRGRSESDLRGAISYFEEATRIDPEFAQAYAGLADCYSLLPAYGYESRTESYAQAFEYAKLAIALDEHSADAQTSYAFSLQNQPGDWREPIRAYERAIDLNPGSARARLWYAQYLSILGRVSEGIYQAELAMELDPVSPLPRIALAEAYIRSRQFDMGIERLEQVLEAEPDQIYALDLIVKAYLLVGRVDDARKTAAGLYERRPDVGSESIVALTESYNANLEEAQSYLDRIEPQSLLELDNLSTVAALHYRTGDIDGALRWIERGIEIHARHMRTEPLLARLEHDPRFWDIMARMNLPPLQPEHPGYDAEQRYLRQRAAEEAIAAQPKPVRRYAIDLGAEYPLAPESGFRDEVLAVSRDGARVVYTTIGVNPEVGLAFRDRDQLDLRPIPGTTGASQPFLSPEGTRVGYWADTQWQWTSLNGGRPTKIKDAAFPTGAHWADDGTIILGGGLSEGLLRYSDAGELLETLSTVDASAGDAVHAMPHALPNGKGVLYTVSTTPGIEGTRVEALSFETGENVVVAHQASIPSYAESGHILYVTQGALMAVRFSLADFAVSGTPIRIAELNLASETTIPSAYALADDGTLWYGTEGADGGLIRFVWLNLDGTEQPTAVEPRARAPFPALSPDGTKVVLDDGRDVFTVDLESGTTNRLTFGEYTERWPTWSQDGEEIYYIAYDGAPQFVKQRANGMGAPESIMSNEGIFIPRLWTPDGSQILGLQMTTGASMDIAVITLGDSPSQEILIGGPAQQMSPALSPDGRWLAYNSDESGTNEIYVRPYPSLEGKWQVSEDGGISPRWSADGSKLYYIRDTQILAVPVSLEPTFSFQRPQTILDSPGFNAMLMVPLFSPDGTRMLVQKPSRGNLESARKLIVVENFFEELKRIAPPLETN